jgi:uncharacterized protein YndB with AHSA1/START domain
VYVALSSPFVLSGKVRSGELLVYHAADAAGDPGHERRSLMTEATAQVSKTIAAPREKVWKALTTPKLMKSFFFGADIETDWRVGRSISFRGEFKGKTYEDKGEIQTFDPEKQLSFSHWSALSGEPDTPEHYHLVMFDLESQGKTTKVTLTQANLTGGVRDSDIKSRKDFEKNWTMVLEGLDKVVTQ